MPRESAVVPLEESMVAEIILDRGSGNIGRPSWWPRRLGGVTSALGAGHETPAASVFGKERVKGLGGERGPGRTAPPERLAEPPNSFHWSLFGPCSSSDPQLFSEKHFRNSTKSPSHCLAQSHSSQSNENFHPKVEVQERCSARSP